VALPRQIHGALKESKAMNRKTGNEKAQVAEIVREYGPIGDRVAGVTHDGHRVWAATGASLVALDPASGEITRKLERACDAGTAFDGKYLYQIAEARIDKIDPATGDVVASIPAPGHGGDSGSPGPRAACGWGSTAIARSIGSIPRRARSSARSSPTASSPA
jgi:hypothetical protein